MIDHHLKSVNIILSRQSLIDAMTHNDKNKLQDLKITFGRLVEEAYPSHDNAVISILMALEAAARDALMGVQWKSDIPTVETIQNAIKS